MFLTAAETAEYFYVVSVDPTYWIILSAFVLSARGNYMEVAPIAYWCRKSVALSFSEPMWQFIPSSLIVVCVIQLTRRIHDNSVYQKMVVN